MKKAGWGAALVALAACAVCYLAGWQGTDWAAQVYRAGQAGRFGLTTWDPGWYGGTFPLNYSLLYPLVAGWVGNWPVAAVAAAGASWCWARLLPGAGPGRWRLVPLYFAAATVIAVAIGQLPTLAGEALGLAAVLGLAHAGRAGAEDGHRPYGALRAALRLAGSFIAALATGLTSPVAGFFLALALGAWSAASLATARRLNRAVMTTGVVALAAVAGTVALPLLFPAPGRFPFPASDLVVVLPICALLGGVVIDVPTPLRWAAGAYAAASVALFVVPNQMGDNDARFAAYIGVPLVLYYLARGRAHLPGHRPLPAGVALASAVVIGAGLVAWEWSPVRDAMSATAHGPSSTRGYYRGLLSELKVLSGGRPVRVEVPPLLHHWESAYIAPTFPLARGWERQLDMAYDPIFYRPGPVAPAAYRAWLLANGVSYVALAAAPLDYAGTAEASLLRRGRTPGLVPVWHDAGWRVWRVNGSPGIVDGAAQLTALDAHGAYLRFGRAGAAVVRLRWSSHWTLSAGAGISGCIRPGPGGWSTVWASGPGEIRLTVTWGTGDHGLCPAPSVVPSG